MSIISSGRLAAAVLAALVFATACGGGDGEEATTTSTTSTTTSTTTTTTVPDGPYAPLTGLPVDEDAELLDQTAIVVKISNNDSVRVWRGIDQADVVFEERIEAQYTRFAAIFHSMLPEQVGPIRSGRTSDIDLLANLGDPILVYSGANPSVTGQLQGLENDGLVTLVVDRGTNEDLVRDTSFRKPDNLFSDLVAIEEKYRDRAGTAVPLFEYQQVDDDERADGVPGEGVTIEGGNTVSIVWDDEQGYVRVQDGEVVATEDGSRFAFDNIVVLEVAYTPSTINPGSVDAQTVGTGPVTIMIGGEQWTGTWERETREDSFTFLDATGDPLLLDPGSSWVTLVPEGSYEFVVDPEIAALVPESDG